MSKVKKILLILIPIFIFFDQLSKQWAIKNIFDDQKIIEINKYLNFVPVWNKGISFGMFSNIENINFFMIFVTLVIILILFFWFFKTIILYQKVALIFIISGAIGNLIDRFTYKAVIDFIDFHINNAHWPAFNLSDTYITIGAFIYLISIFDSKKFNYV